MTPYEIRLLIHFHTTPSPYEGSDAPIYQPTIDSFIANGLIEECDGSYQTTDRGAAHIEQLCATPWPIQKWVNQAGNIINE